MRQNGYFIQRIVCNASKEAQPISLRKSKIVNAMIVIAAKQAKHFVTEITVMNNRNRLHSNCTSVLD
jgi:hypothetical protein